MRRVNVIWQTRREQSLDGWFDRWHYDDLGSMNIGLLYRDKIEMLSCYNDCKDR